MTDLPMQEQMRACACFLADQAIVENGRLYVNGGFWSQVYSAAYPVVTRASAMSENGP